MARTHAFRQVRRPHPARGSSADDLGQGTVATDSPSCVLTLTGRTGFPGSSRRHPVTARTSPAAPLFLRHWRLLLGEADQDLLPDFSQAISRNHSGARPALRIRPLTWYFTVGVAGFEPTTSSSRTRSGALGSWQSRYQGCSFGSGTVHYCPGRSSHGCTVWPPVWPPPVGPEIVRPTAGPRSVEPDRRARKR